MPKNTLLGAAAFAFVALCSTAFADIFTLKSGEKIEGKIASETPTELNLEVKVSAGITDTRKVLKADVASVTKDQPDELAWTPLKNLKLSANSMPAASYAPTIASLKGFIEQFPASSHIADAQKALTAFE